MAMALALRVLLVVLGLLELGMVVEGEGEEGVELLQRLLELGVGVELLLLLLLLGLLLLRV